MVEETLMEPELETDMDPQRDACGDAEIVDDALRDAMEALATLETDSAGEVDALLLACDAEKDGELDTLRVVANEGDMQALIDDDEQREMEGETLVVIDAGGECVSDKDADGERELLGEPDEEGENVCAATQCADETRTASKRGAPLLPLLGHSKARKMRARANECILK